MSDTLGVSLTLAGVVLFLGGAYCFIGTVGLLDFEPSWRRVRNFGGGVALVGVALFVATGFLW